MKKLEQMVIAVIPSIITNNPEMSDHEIANKSIELARTVLSRMTVPISPKTPLKAPHWINLFTTDVDAVTANDELYKVYLLHSGEQPLMSKIAFNRALKVYFPQLTYGRGNDIARTVYIKGIRVKTATTGSHTATSAAHT